MLTTPLFCSCKNLNLEKWTLFSARIKASDHQNKIFSKKAMWIRETFKQDFTRSPSLQPIQPALGAGVLLVQGNKVNGVHTYTLEQGKKKWFFPVKEGLAGDVLVQSTFVFFGGSDGFFYSLYLSTGKVAWKYYTGQTTVSAPVIKGKYIYFASLQKVYCLNKKTGENVWTYSIPLKPREFIVQGVARPLIGKYFIYVKAGDGSLLALNLKGQLKWKIKSQGSGNRASRFTSAASSPVMGKICLYYTNFNTGLYCVNSRNGRLIWKTNEGSHAEILLSGSRLFYPTSEGSVRALDQKTGKEIWKHKMAESLATSFVSYKGALLYGEYSGALQALSRKTGKKLDSFHFGSGMSASPLVSSLRSEVYFLSNIGWFYKVKLKSYTF